jgi:hypothetical protein
MKLVMAFGFFLLAGLTVWALGVYFSPNMALDFAGFMQMCATLLGAR